MSSIYGHQVQNLEIYKKTKIKQNPIYSISKAALNMFVKNAALNYGKFNIRINAVSPGAINNPMDKNIKDNKFLSNYIKNVPLKRIAEYDDISNIIEFLLSDKSSYITGEIIKVDGGFLLN